MEDSVTCEICNKGDVELAVMPCCQKKICWDFCLYEEPTECPYCGKEIEVTDGKCSECHQDIGEPEVCLRSLEKEESEMIDVRKYTCVFQYLIIGVDGDYREFEEHLKHIDKIVTKDFRGEWIDSGADLTAGSTYEVHYDVCTTKGDASAREKVEEYIKQHDLPMRVWNTEPTQCKDGVVVD